MTDEELKREIWMEARDNSEFGKWLASMTPQERSELWQSTEEEECLEKE